MKLPVTVHRARLGPVEFKVIRPARPPVREGSRARFAPLARAVFRTAAATSIGVRPGAAEIRARPRAANDSQAAAT
ncbi:hypothetical protein [Streptomyces sp. NPDC054958]